MTGYLPMVFYIHLRNSNSIKSHVIGILIEKMVMINFYKDQLTIEAYWQVKNIYNR